MRSIFYKIFLLPVGLALFMPPLCLAQTEPSAPEGYVPPPLFGSPSDVTPVFRKSATDSWGEKNHRPIVKPRVSVSNENEPLEYKPYIPPVKPLKKPVKEQPLKKAPPPPGIVKGAKTMPAVPAGGVQSDQTFTAAPDKPEDTLLERHRKKQTARQKRVENITAAPPPPEEDVQDLTKLSLPFSAGQTALDTKQALTISHNIARRLRQDPALRLQIESFAGAVDSGRSSDRQVALNRALAIRKVLLSENIAPHRIDVRAMGAKTDQTPLERVDLYLSR